MKRLFYFILLVSSSVAAQTKGKLALNELPDVNKVWGTEEYKVVTVALRNAVSKGQELPKLSDNYYAGFFRNLISRDNLAIYTDTTVTIQKRAVATQSFTELLPELTEIFASEGLHSEAIVLTEFMMEAVFRTTLVIREKFQTSSEQQKSDFITTIKNSQAIYKTLSGSLGCMDAAGEADTAHLTSLVRWYLNHVPDLWGWMNPGEQESFRENIKTTLASQRSVEVKSLLEQLLKKLETF